MTRYRMLPVALVLGSILAVPGWGRDSSPRERYNIDMTCAAVTSSGVTLPGRRVGDTRAVAALYVRRIAASGKAAGLSPQRIAGDLTRQRAVIARRFTGGNPSAAADERARASLIGEQCAALPAFEAEGRLTGTR